MLYPSHDTIEAIFSISRDCEKINPIEIVSYIFYINRAFKNFQQKLLLFHSHCAKLYLYSCQSNRAIPLLLFVYKAVTRKGGVTAFCAIYGKIE